MSCASMVCGNRQLEVDAGDGVSLGVVDQKTQHAGGNHHVEEGAGKQSSGQVS